MARRSSALVTAMGRNDHHHHNHDVHHEHHWTNWGGNQHVHPADVVTPSTEAELEAIVGRGVAEGHKVKVVGSGHSFSDIACTDGLMVSVGAFHEILHVDRAQHRVTVGAGIVLADLNTQLWDLEMSLPNLGDIDQQTLAGAIATATHGTGATFDSISAAVVGARIVTGDGSVLEVSETQRSDLLSAVRVGIGALGIVTALTMQCEPAFNLHAVESTHDVDALLDDIDDLVGANDHVEFYWFPHTRTGQLKVNNRTTEPSARRGKFAAFLNDELLSNAGFGALNLAGRRFPGLIPRAMGMAMKPGSSFEYVAPSYEVFCAKRRVRFVEMEYAIPRSDLQEAFGRVRALVNQLGRPISFPIEVRVLGADDTALGTASGRATAYVACHVYRGTRYDDYFGGVERIMADYGGRPHWGKLHTHAAETLSPLYPRWGEFQTALDELDPDGHFSNPYLDRVLRGNDFTSR
jgi:FAD-linked oxidoreductase